ncbi:phosphatase PAP2 family protein [Bacillus sp. JJ864]|uniref:phosphatase PAP2 family protein n=1 Tax=Bacillus sp. JJ864 TaxID=3122975 RepID=UPI002FFE0E8C
MKTRSISSLYKIECYIFKGINHYFDRKALNIFFRTITHMGGATFTIALIIFLLVLTNGSLRGVAIASAISLLISHIPVQIFKKCYPRKRPYLTIHNAKYPMNPLVDHSFPSGHTTAIFSVIIPFLLYEPRMTFLLLPVAICVGISRIYLGLHYPSDVLVGMCLGTIAGIVSYYQFIPLFI